MKKNKKDPKETTYYLALDKLGQILCPRWWPDTSRCCCCSPGPHLIRRFRQSWSGQSFQQDFNLFNVSAN